MITRPVVLCFVSHYLPGFRSGGPIRTIASFADHLGDEFDIRIVTSDRDAMDKSPYSGVDIDRWNRVGNALVFYASRQTMTLRGVTQLLNATPHDLLYLNSFFSWRFTVMPLLARRLRRPMATCVVAPRGELDRNALALKAWKKRPFKRITRWIGLYKGLRWQASCQSEVDAIHREMGVLRSDIFVAPDLAPRPGLVKASGRPRIPGPLRMVFLSRISPMKNLDFLLKALQHVNAPVSLTVVGPVRDLAYWVRCESLIRALPKHISTQYIGEIPHSAVGKLLAGFDLFVLPTRGENFGHVVLEAVTAGTPALISDRTHWKHREGAIDVVPLSSIKEWAYAIERWAAVDERELVRRREVAAQYAMDYFESSESIDKNRRGFLDALNAPVVD